MELFLSFHFIVNFMKIKSKTTKAGAKKSPRRRKPSKMQKQLTKMNGTSKLEDKFEEILKELGEPYVKHYRFGRREFDFCLTEKKLLIEIHGCFWHGCKECGVEVAYGPQKRSVKNDKHKTKLVEASLDYNLITFWEHEIEKDKPKVIMELINALA